MGDDKNKLDYEIQTTLQECVSYLQELLNGLKQGEIVLRHRSEAMDLRPSSVVAMHVKAKQKGAKESISFEVNWKRAESATSVASDPLRIEAPRSE